MLKQRLILGPVMIALLLAVFYIDDQLDRVRLQDTAWQDLFLGRDYLPSGLLMLAALLVMITLATRELALIFQAKGVPVSKLMLWIAAVLGCLLIYIMPHDNDSQTALALYASVMVGVFVAALVRHSWRRRTEGAVLVGSAALFALIYLGTLPGFYLAIRRWHSAWMIVAIILVTKACDIGAYFTGLSIGKHKLIPWLSPGKTWEGLAGGVVLSAVVAVVLAAIGKQFDLSGVWIHEAGVRRFVEFNLPLWYAAIAGLLIGLVGQFGDLTASLFKRDAGVKDSGRSIPGFGGLLDVIDSPIVVAPVAYWLLRLAAASGPIAAP